MNTLMVKERDMPVGYDNFALHRAILLDLPFREYSGIVTRDVSKPRRTIDLPVPPAWSSIASGLGVLDFSPGDYGECLAADTGDLDFTSGDYSLAVWINSSFSAQSKMVLARYGTDLDGWELYLFDSGIHHYLTLRHHHQSLAPDTRDGCYSDGWVNGTWFLLGVSRSGLYPRHFRNGLELEVTYETGGLKDPDPCARDLVIGCRYTKNTDWYIGMMWRPRIFNWSLDNREWLELFNMERHWLGV